MEIKSYQHRNLNKIGKKITFSRSTTSRQPLSRSVASMERERERLDSWLIDGGRREGKRERLDSREERMREKSRMGGRRAEREVSGREKLEK